MIIDTNIEISKTGEGSITNYSAKPASSPTGYVKYRIAPDGFKTVYGRVTWNRTNNQDSHGVTINFGTEFTDLNYGVAVNAIDSTTSYYHIVGTYEIERTTNSVTILLQNSNNASNNAGFSFLIQGV